MISEQDWTNDPRLQKLDTSKLELLKSMAGQGSGKSASEMLPFLLSAASMGSASGLSFTEEETSAIIDVLKQGKSPAYQKKLDKMVKMMKML